MTENKILTDEITKFDSLYPRILIALATVGIATTGQLVRLTAGLSVAEAEALDDPKKATDIIRNVIREAERLRDVEGYIKEKRAVELPRHMKKAIVDVWYLSEKGLLAAKVIDEYFTRFSKAGLPPGTNRIPHELAVTESFLLLSKKHTVCDYFPEWEIKRRLIANRTGTSKKSNNNDHPSEATGDFKVMLLPKEQRNAERFIVEGEAAINYRKSQIKAKPNNMLWFVTSQIQKDIVNVCKKDKIRGIWTVGDVTAPFENKIAENRTLKEKSNQAKGVLEQKITRYLLTSGGAFTRTALAVILKEDRGNISRSLGKLEKTGEINHTEIKLTPSEGRGRPNKLFWHKLHNQQHDNPEFTERAKKLVLSESIIYFAKKEYALKKTSNHPLQAEFKAIGAVRNRNIMIIYDDETQTADDIGRELKNIHRPPQNDKNEIKNYTILAVTTEDRMNELRTSGVREITFIAETKSVNNEI